MASYSRKLSEKKYNNWIKAQLAVLLTREGIEPFVFDEIKQFQHKCLNNIYINNGQSSVTLCSSCLTENVVYCPTNRICSVVRGKCSYHKNSRTRYLHTGCPRNICHNFKHEIQNVHRFNGPSYKNTDATHWCSDPWEIAKCFMPPDGYKDVACATETDFNGIISVIINHKGFQSRINENLSHNPGRNNIFQQARDIGKTVRHSSKLEIEDNDLEQYFRVLQTLLSDPIYLAKDIHAQNAKQKLIDLEKDTLIIEKDFIRKALDDVAKAAQEKIRTEIDEQKKLHEMILLNMIKEKQKHLEALEIKTVKGVQQIETKTDASLNELKTVISESENKIERKCSHSLNRIETSIEKSLDTLKNQSSTERENIYELVNKKRKHIDEEGETQLKRMKETSDKIVDTIKEQGNKERKDLIAFGETWTETIYTRINENKEKQYIADKKKLKYQLIAWYRDYHSTVPLSPITDDLDTPLAGFYVMPEISMQTTVFSDNKETMPVKSLNDIFGSSRKVHRRIYLSADAGFGKTAFSKYLATLWCQAHFNDENYSCFKEEDLLALSGFDFTFLVLLRYSSGVCHVDEMIEQQIIERLPCSKSLPKNFVTEILSCEKCLVILDGLDEWTHPEKFCIEPTKTIPHRYAQQNCVNLTTTRPWKLGDSNIKTSQIDMSLELVQLSDQLAFQLEQNALQKMKSGISDEKLKRQTLNLHDEIKDLCLTGFKVPLILMYIVSLWCDGKPIGKSKCELYSNIIELLLTRTLKKYSKLETSSDPLCELPQCFSRHVNCHKYSTLIMAIGKLAFNTLFSDQKENTLVFTRSIAEEHLSEEQLEFCLHSGILTENKVKKFTEQISKMSFSHKTVQECFTAVFISGQKGKEDKKTIVEKCRSLQDVLDMKILLLFLSGMNPRIMSSISYDLMPVINNDETTCKYRTMTYTEYRYKDPLKEMQSLLISCIKECQQYEDLKLCLQDFFITEECQQGTYFIQLQHLYHQNKNNIKSIHIENEGICSLKEIINLFALCDLQGIEKLYYKGEIVEQDMISLLLKPLRCFIVISRKWENNQLVTQLCPLSAMMVERLGKSHLERLYINCFTMPHQVMETLFSFLSSKTSMKESTVSLNNLYCSDHKASCKGFNIDLAQYSDLRGLLLDDIPVSQLSINVSSLEKCYVGELYKPGVVSSYLSQITAANKLQTFMCSSLKSSSDIESMLQTLPLLVLVKEIILFRISLGEKLLTLSLKMVNIELVYLWHVTMSCSVLHDLIKFVNKIPHSVTIVIRGCNITPEIDFEKLKTFIKSTDKFMVTFDGMYQSGKYMFQFKTITN